MEQMPTSRNLPQKLRQQILVPGALCHWCGATATECDHLIEHDRGGDDSTSNLVPACKPCNAKRGAIYKARKQAHIMQQRNEILKNKNCKKKNISIYYSLSFSMLGGRDSTRALQSSPFQISGGGTLSVTEEEEEEDGRNPCI